MFTLKKLKLEADKNSVLPQGYQTTASRLQLFDHVTDELKDINSISQVEEGWQILLTASIGEYHRTSKIRKIVSISSNRIVFKTQTSIYELIEH